MDRQIHVHSYNGMLHNQNGHILIGPSPGDHPDPGIQPTSLCLLHWQESSLPSEAPGKPRFWPLCVCSYVPIFNSYIFN